MFSRRFLLAALLAPLPAQVLAQGTLLNQGRQLLNQHGGPTTPGAKSLSAGDIGAGLKDALKIGAQRTIGRVGKTDGYLKDPSIRIPLPDTVERIRPALKMAGAGGMLDDLELRMNRGAETAAPKALTIFTDAISRMTIDDARGILQGPQDAATQYFRRSTSEPLGKAFRPIIDNSLGEAGAVKALNGLKQQAGGLAGMVGGFDLTDFTLDKALAGLFHYLAQEEAAIRTNPAARSTDLLKKVFG